MLILGETAFCGVISQDDNRRNFPYFCGIVKSVKDKAYIARHEDYCRRRYNYLQMLERERQHSREEKDDLVPDVLVDMMHTAISLPARRSLCGRQRKWF
jgi:hypothetical protein